MDRDIIDFVRNGLAKHREAPGWLTIADETGVNYSTIWRIANGHGDSKLSTIQPIADWLRKKKFLNPLATADSRAGGR